MMPDPDKPNALVAAMWSDLLVDENSSITYGDAFDGEDLFIISWDNVLDKSNNQRQTFQIVLRHPQDFKQSMVFINYKSVVASSSGFAFGIEDDEGLKGTGGIVQDEEFTERRFKFSQNSNPTVLNRLTINFDENDDDAKIWIWEDPLLRRGHHLSYEIPNPANDPTFTFLLALSGPLILLATHSGVVALIKIAGIVRYILIPFKVADFVAKLANLLKDNVEVLDARDSYGHFGNPPLPQGAYITVLPEDYVVDAILGISVLWVFTDEDSSRDHSLRVSATVGYDEYDITDGTLIGSKNVTTSVDLNVVPDAGNSVEDARYVTPGQYLAYVHSVYDQRDYYNVTVPANKCVWLILDMTSSLYADLYLYNPSGVEVKKSERSGNATEYINYYATSPGNYSIKVKATLGEGLYNLEIVISQPFELKVETRQTNNVEIEEVKVWIDYDANHSLSPVTINVAAANHTVEVESMFIRTEFPDFYLYTFVEWEDGSTGNPRTVPVSENRTITAYYKKEYAGGIFKPVP